MARKKKALLTKNQLDIIYECWKEGVDTKERLILIEQRMPKVPTLKALKIMRRMAKTDAKWLRWSTRQENLKEKEKIDKQKEREQKRKEQERRKKEREEKKKERIQKQTQKIQKEQISKYIESSLAAELKEQADLSFFFCPDIHQYVSNISCIFRIFSEDFSFGTSCDKCKRMDKYIPIIKEIIDGRSVKNTKKQRSKGNTPRRGKGEDEIKKPSNSKAKTTGVKGDAKCSTTSRHTSRKSRTTNRRSS